MVVKMNKHSIITVALAKDPALIQNALLFINAIALEAHNASPPPPPKILFTATNGSIVGTIALDIGDESQQLPLEEIYQFITSPFSSEFQRKDVAQYGRWMCPGIPRISIALAYIATLYALHIGKTYGWFEAKPFIANRLSSIGMQLEEIPDATLLLRNVPEAGRSYYTEQPAPRIYRMRLEQFASALAGQVARMIEENILLLDTSFLTT